MKAKMRRVVAALEAVPATASLVPELWRFFGRAKRDCRHKAWCALTIVLVGFPLIGFLWAMRDGFRFISGVVGYLPYEAIFAALEAWPASVPATALIILGLWWGRRLYLSYRLVRFLDERIEIDPVAIGAARAQIAVRPAEVMFRAMSIVVAAIMVITGVLWCAVAFIATTAALDCARSSKCM
jgi:hypothetical protein